MDLTEGQCQKVLDEALRGKKIQDKDLFRNDQGSLVYAKLVNGSVPYLTVHGTFGGSPGMSKVYLSVEEYETLVAKLRNEWRDI